MKKKILVLSLVLSFLCSGVAFASEKEEINSTSNTRVISHEVEVLENGDTIEHTLKEDVSEISTFAARKSKSVTYTYAYQSKGKTLWQITLKGAFTYNGLSSECTGVSLNIDKTTDGWKKHSSSAYKNKNQAKGRVEMRKVGSSMVTRTFIITCSKTGVISYN